MKVNPSKVYDIGIAMWIDTLSYMSCISFEIVDGVYSYLLTYERTNEPFDKNFLTFTYFGLNTPFVIQG